MDTNLQKYMAFIKTAEYSSFTRAAEILHYSQSGISRMIHDLEKEWNIQLLERSHGSVSLTSDGLQIFPQIKTLCAEYEKLQMQVDELKGLQTGLIRIGAFSSVATHWLPNIIRAFQKDYPNISYEIVVGDYAEIETWIQEGRVDCGFVHLPIHTELETIFLEQDQIVAVLPADHQLVNKEKLSVSDLCHDPFMLLERGVKSEVTTLFEQYHVTPNICFTTWDDYTVMSMVESGLGISATPRLILTRMPYNIVIKELDPPAYRSICIAIKSKKSASLAVKRFLEYLDYRHGDKIE
ncbi:MAG: LysR family transcriptional regulator [Clostridia bacterium]|nr:LysR family transcriptional regulator [Clostridia bacterium]